MNKAIKNKNLIIKQTENGEQIRFSEALKANEEKTIFIFALATQNGVDLEIQLNEPNSKLDVYCLYIVNGKKAPKFKTVVTHKAENCKSNILYKGVLLSPDSKAFWDSDVVIEKTARGTDTYEANRNMILSRGARVYSVPNLEILQGDIQGAGHASAVGRFDEEELFYLMSRGLNEKEAKELLVDGFSLEILDHLNDETLKKEFTAKIRELLKGESLLKKEML
ncbi:MAG: SufD family Fe-S cluster assembly protein [Bifidobacteriaceae bacterium]|jgi:Fe-S cluster assembly protein SufD|nr:SufD family Fe-S cluster assembly protein [Bifidobacteriaceae bacterium]